MASILVQKKDREFLSINFCAKIGSKNFQPRSIVIGSKPRLLIGGYQSTNQKETSTSLYKAQPDHMKYES